VRRLSRDPVGWLVLHPKSHLHKRREMKKLKLDLETIEVLSFRTTPESEPLDGTVEGAMVTHSLCTSSCRGTSVCCETE
jgi:hypothetical protein